MKVRIVSSIIQLTTHPDTWTPAIEKMVKPLITEHRMSKELIRQQAIVVAGNILHNYSDLAATTIDSFMQRVIRTFSHDLNLPQNYEVELDTNSLRQRAVDRLIDQAGSDKGLTDLLVHFLESKTEDDKSWRIENDLNAVAQALFREDGTTHRDALRNLDYADYQNYYRKIYQWISEFEIKLQSEGDEALLIINRNKLEISDFAYGKSGALGYFIKLQNKDFSKVENPGIRILAAIHEGIWATKNQTPRVSEKIENIAPELIRLYNQSQELVKESFQRYKILSLLLKNIYPLAVLGSIDRIINQINEEEQILPITDFNRIIACVTQTETIPYIYERLGDKYHHLMIDEFQDTSVLQWQNILPLVDNALSQNYMNLVVGDAKQAIYRWRNGEVDQFISLPKLHGKQNAVNHEREQNLLNHHEIKELPVNWRSHKAIVEFNNHLFRHLSNRLAPAYKTVYENMDQKHNPQKDKGFVQVEFFDPDNNTENAMLERLPELIRELLDFHYKQGDIAVLCRTNKQGSEIAGYLLKHDINVISSESLLLGSSESVKLLMCLLRIMADSADQLAYAKALAILERKGIFGIKKLNGLALEVLAEEPVNRKIHFKINAFEELLQNNGINFSRFRLLHLPLYDLADELIRLLNLSYHDDIYLQFFLNELHRTITQKSMTIRELPKWWEEKGSRVSVIFPESLDAVNVMTIHKSKGLEFPVVIYPFAKGNLKETIRNVWLDINDPLTEKLNKAWLPVSSLGGTAFEEVKQMETEKSLLDMINLLYVVLTRAEERLYILTNMVDQADLQKNSVEAFISDFLYSADPAFADTDGLRWRYPQSVECNALKSSPARKEFFFRIDSSFQSNYRHSNLLTSSRRHHKWEEDAMDNASNFGTSIHAILAGIKTADDLEPVLDHHLVSGELSPDEKLRIRKTLRCIIEHPVLQPFFIGNNQTKSEPEILLPGGDILRPDRIVTGDSETLVAEFKTGQPHAHHQTQLVNYMEMMKIMFQNNVKGFLVYANEEVCTVKEI